MTITTSTDIIPYVPPLFSCASAKKEVIKARVEDVVLRFLVIPRNIIAEVLQSEVAFTNASDPKPIIASYGAGPCVIMSGYSPSSRIGFIAHFSHAGEVDSCSTNILGPLEELLKGKAEEFSLTLKGGIEGDPISMRTIDSIKRWVSTPAAGAGGIAFKINSIDLLKSAKEPSKSLRLDTRTGDINDYDPLRDNPLHFRRLTPRDVLHAKFSFEVRPTLKVAYSPEGD